MNDQDKSVVENRELFDVIDEVTDRFHGGENVQLEALIAKHPEHEAELRKVLPALAAINGIGDCPSNSPGGDFQNTTVNKQLGDFQIVREIGRGGMGVVYEAMQVSLGRQVALKVLPFAGVMDQRQLARFKNEAQAAALLQHTNIVPIHYVGSERGVHFYAMQYIEGASIAEVIDLLKNRSDQSPSLRFSVEDLSILRQEESGIGGDDPTIDSDASPHVDKESEQTSDTVPVAAISTVPQSEHLQFYRRIAELGIQIAEALDHAHTHGVLHRDIKPANLMLDFSGNVWLTDFGLARLEGNPNLTMTGDIIGTLRYMSPEQVLAKRVIIDHRSDIYSLGATLYELLTFQPVFVGRDRAELLREVAFEQPVKPGSINKAIPKEIETIVLKALRKNPSDRYETAQELADDLRRFLDDRPILAKPPTLVDRSAMWARRHKPLVASAVSAIAMLLIATTIGSLIYAAQLQRQQEQGGRVNGNILETLAAIEAFDLNSPPSVGDHWAKTRERYRQLEILIQDELADPELVARAQELCRQVDQVEKTRQFMECLDSLMRPVFDAMGNSLHRADSSDWKLAFVEFGVVPNQGSVQAAANLIKTQPSWAIFKIIMGLDAWQELKDTKSPTRKWLRSLATTVDSDLWRSRLRNAVATNDPSELLSLAAQPDIDQQSAYILKYLGVKLCSYPEHLGSGLAILRRAQRRHPSDFWLSFNIDVWLPEANIAEKLRYASIAVALEPNLAGPRCNLGIALYLNGDLDGAIAEYSEALRIHPGYGAAHFNLGKALRDSGNLDGAITAFRQATRLLPDYAPAHHDLGRALKANEDLEGAIVEFRQVIRIQPGYAPAHVELGNALYDSGNPDRAITAYRQAIQIQPDDAGVHYNLGNALHNNGNPDGAIAAYREAIRINPDHGKAHTNLGVALKRQENLKEAIIHYREAIRIQPGDAMNHNNLGNALRADRALEEARDEYQEAIRIQPEWAEAHRSLGLVLGQLGCFKEALVSMQRCHELGSLRADWQYPSDTWVHDCARELKFAEQLPRVMAGVIKPSELSEWQTYGDIAYVKQLYVSAAFCFDQGLNQNPSAVSRINDQWRYRAVCCAALAGSGKGPEGVSLTSEDQASWRNKSLLYLRQELSHLHDRKRSADTSASVAIFLIRRTLLNWLSDPDLAGIRESDSLARLNTGERTEFKHLWADVESLLEKVRQTGEANAESKQQIKIKK